VSVLWNRRNVEEIKQRSRLLFRVYPTSRY
jgi:hypothetical protein